MSSCFEFSEMIDRPYEPKIAFQGIFRHFSNNFLLSPKFYHSRKFFQIILFFFFNINIIDDTRKYPFLINLPKSHMITRFVFIKFNYSIVQFMFLMKCVSNFWTFTFAKSLSLQMTSCLMNLMFDEPHVSRLKDSMIYIQKIHPLCV